MIQLFLLPAFPQGHTPTQGCRLPQKQRRRPLGRLSSNSKEDVLNAQAEGQVTLTRLLPCSPSLSLLWSWLWRQPCGSTSSIDRCTQCQEELLQAKGRTLLGPFETWVPGKCGAPGSHPTPNLRIIWPPQPGSGLGPPVLSDGQQPAQGYQRSGEEVGQGSILQMTETHTLLSGGGL